METLIEFLGFDEFFFFFFNRGMGLGTQGPLTLLGLIDLLIFFEFFQRSWVVLWVRKDEPKRCFMLF